MSKTVIRFFTISDYEEEEEIFSDCESRIDMLENLLKTRMLPLLVIFLCCCVPNLFRSTDSDVGTAFQVFWIVMTVTYVFLLTHCGLKLRTLKEKYGR